MATGECEVCMAAADSRYPPCIHCGQIICTQCCAAHMNHCAPVMVHSANLATGTSVTIYAANTVTIETVIRAVTSLAELIDDPLTRDMLHTLSSGRYWTVIQRQLAEMTLNNSGDRPVVDIKILTPTTLPGGHCAQQ